MFRLQNKTAVIIEAGSDIGKKPLHCRLHTNGADVRVTDTSGKWLCTIGQSFGKCE
jgi:hypothetical protein